MHNFAHHYLVPAVLMAEVCLRDGTPEAEFGKKLDEVRRRARNVLPAFCGLYGACGAAVGCGIFMSVYTGTTPLSKDTWSLCNYATAGALSEMAKLGGPRCCKRNTFAALLFMKKYIAQHLGTVVGVPDGRRVPLQQIQQRMPQGEMPLLRGGGLRGPGAARISCIERRLHDEKYFLRRGARAADIFARRRAGRGRLSCASATWAAASSPRWSCSRTRWAIIRTRGST